MKHDKITQSATTELRAEVVDNHADFLKSRQDWQALEQIDPQASVFLSWDWMAEAFRDTLYRWSVIVVRKATPAAEIVCIVPLKYRVHWSNSRQEFQTELQAAGRLLWSEYTGFVCAPDHERDGLIAAAAKLARMPWVKLSMRYVGQHERCRIFTDALTENGFSVRYKEYLINQKQTNNLKCPQIDLPQDFDDYLKTQISRNKRQQYNRFKRRHLDTGEYHITAGNDATLESDLDALLKFWKTKWRDQKGAALAERVAQNYRDILSAAHRTGNLFLPVLRQGDTPLGALGHIVDHRKGMVHFILVGRDTGAQEHFVGAALHFFSIEWAIAQGYAVYDFCHGDEPYKYGYGAQDIELLYFEARRKELSPDAVFDSLSLGAALKRMETFIEEGRTSRAARGCAQLAKLLS